MPMSRDELVEHMFEVHEIEAGVATLDWNHGRWIECHSMIHAAATQFPEAGQLIQPHTHGNDELLPVHLEQDNSFNGMEFPDDSDS